MKHLFYYLFVFSVGLVSCTDNDSTIDPDIDLPIGHASFTIELPGLKEPTTYAIDETDENTIKEIDVLFFKRMNNGDDLFCYRMKLSEQDITEAAGSVNGERKAFDIEIRKDSLIIAIIANARASVDQIADFLSQGNRRKEEVYERLVFSQTGKWPATSGNFTPFPMWGETPEMVRVDDSSIGPIPLFRSVARIDLGIDVFGDPALGFGRKFKLKDIYVYNVLNKGNITPDVNDPGITENDPKATYAFVPSDGEALNNPLKYEYVNNGEIVQQLFNEIYITESEANNVCVVVSGYYDNGPEAFYKIAFAINDHYIPLIRNYRYLINIKGVRRQGYSTLDEAYQAEAANMTHEIILNDLYELTEFEFNGQYTLAVGEGKKNVDWKEQTAEILVNTTYGGGWNATVDQASLSWITLLNSSGNGKLHENDTLRFKVERNADFFVRKGKIILKAGTLTKEIIVQQRLGSNCYILKPGTGTVEIPVAFANADGKMRLTESTTVGAKLVWADRTDVIDENIMITGTGKNTLLNVSAHNEGNAVVVAYDANSMKPIWTWHIWVTDYDPNYVGDQETNNNRIFMDRNLGALTDDPTSIDVYGLLYQWGRKDPFPGAESFNIADQSYTGKPLYGYGGNPVLISYTEITEQTTHDETLVAPLTFFTNHNHPHNWHQNGANNLWSDNGEKTPYDPSPEGWKVPESGKGPDSPWYGYAIDNGGWDNSGGRLFYGHTYYPAAGARTYADGSFFDVSRRCYVWSATAAGFQAFCLNFGPTSVATDATFYKGNAYPVRCVKEQN